MSNTSRMKLRARDAEDLGILAAFLQDAILPVKEMTYLPNERRFVVLFNRFKWEQLPKDGPVAALETPPAEPDPDDREDEDAAFDEVDESNVFERVHCAVTFDGVRDVKLRAIDRKDKKRVLELLTIETGRGEISLVFADDAAIRLKARKVRVHMEDLGEPWPTTNLPRHGDAEEEAGKAPDLESKTGSND